MGDANIWVFLGLMGAAGVAIPFVFRRLRRQADERVAQACRSLAETGVVVEEVTNQQGRKIVRIWGRLDHPVSLDLRIARRGKILGQLGPDSPGSLDPLFARSFRISSREPERAVLAVSPEIQHRLAGLGRLELRLGSFDSLLPPDYRQPEQTPADRRLRGLWMIRVPIRKRSRIPRDELADLGRLLAKSIAKHCLPPGTPDLSEFRTGRSEGQWL